MSLLQLLTVNRSFRNVRDEPTPYKMSDKVALPKFAPARRPILLAPVLEERMAAVAAVVTDSMFDSQAVAAVAATSLADAPPRVSAAATPVTAPAPGSQIVIAQASLRPSVPVGRWALMRNPFDSSPGPAARVGSAQGELSLDAVKPVRNDLSDADLEVVAVSLTAELRPHQIAGTGATRGCRWSRLVARVFRFGRAQA